jgi:hypothetical protein
LPDDALNTLDFIPRNGGLRMDETELKAAGKTQDEPCPSAYESSAGDSCGSDAGWRCCRDAYTGKGSNGDGQENDGVNEKAHDDMERCHLWIAGRRVENGFQELCELRSCPPKHGDGDEERTPQNKQFAKRRRYGNFNGRQPVLRSSNVSPWHVRRRKRLGVDAICSCTPHSVGAALACSSHRSEFTLFHRQCRLPRLARTTPSCH